MRLLTPQELREATVRDFKAAFLNSGRRVADHEVEKIALASLELVAAAERVGDVSTAPQSKPKPDPEAPVKPRDKDALQAAFADRGVHEASGRAMRFRALHGTPQEISERWGYACGRINRILEGAGRATTINGAVKNATVPRLAKKFMDLFGWFMTFAAPAPLTGTDRNPFRNMPVKEVGLKFMRLVEDICDESTGTLGSWYVK